MLLLALTILLQPAAATSAASGATTGAATGATANATADADSGETLFLEVEVNGRAIGKIGEFTLRRGVLMARPEELIELGFRVPVSRALGRDALIALSDLPGLTWRVDQKTQTMHVTTSNERLLPTQLQLDKSERQIVRRVIESGTGVTLNYDVTDSFAGGRNGGSGALDMRAFSPWGVLSSGLLAYAGTTSGGNGGNTAIRLDSTYSLADVNTLRRYSLGDFITGSLGWNRPIRLGGAQVLSDFSMRPDLVTFPLPAVKGSVAVPSTVDVLTNGSLRTSGQVPAGPFEIPQLPVMTGAGTISMTMTNALGQQVTLTQPFYASPALLAPGLQTFSAQAGLVRHNWGVASNDYGKAAGMAIYRRGLTSAVTVEGSVEGTPGTFMAGAGGVVRVGTVGVINFAAAASAGSAHPSAQFSLGAQRIGKRFSLGASAILAGRKYRDVASMNGDGVLRKQLSAFTSLSLKRFGSIGVAYGGISQDASPTPLPFNAVSATHSRVISASYSVQFHHVSFYATEFRDLTNKGGSGLQVGMTIPLRKRSSIALSGASNGSGQVQIQQPASMIGDWGYRASLSADDNVHVFSQGQYKSRVGLFTAGVDRNAGQTTVRAESQGAISFVDGGIFLSNTIYDSFAIVDTAPMAHVHVLQENRNVGTTGSSGRVLVPDMRSFDLNRIGIVATDVPPDATIGYTTREVRPQNRSGVVVRFSIKFNHGALLQLVDEAGLPVPLGSIATLRATGVTVPVGYDGNVYVEGLSPHNELIVESLNERHCTVAFDYQPVPGDIPSIGPLRCLEQTP